MSVADRRVGGPAEGLRSASTCEHHAIGRFARLIRIVVVVLCTLVIVLAGAAAYLLLGGGFVTYPRAALSTKEQRATAAAWTAVCPLGGPGYLNGEGCAAVEGKVIYVQKRDPDGDGDLHIVLLAGPHVRLVKMFKAYRPARPPSIGTHLTAGGWVRRGSSGRGEIYATKLCRPSTNVRKCPVNAAFGG